MDVIPLFLETAPDLQIDDGDLRISSPSSHGVEQGRTGHAVCVQHIPTGISVQSSGNKWTGESSLSIVILEFEPFMWYQEVNTML